jgi:hypothetical protein
MTWEYMDELDYRYEEAIGEIKDLLKEGDVVVDLCSGNSRFGNYLPSGIKYLSCDLYDDRAEYQMRDDEFVRTVVNKCDVLALFGYGGYDVDHHPLESNTVLNSMEYLIKTFNPKVIYIENIYKYDKVITDFMKEHKDYEVVTILYKPSEYWLDNRVLKVWKKK